LGQKSMQMEEKRMQRSRSPGCWLGTGSQSDRVASWLVLARMTKLT
jgi:hypothetical protein